jgi:uncharacterized protein (DUF1501 family)
MKSTRRDFLHQMGCGAVTAAAIAAGIDRFGTVSALAQGTGYRALVCIFLAGGNDGNNMIVPLDSSGYAAYSSVRSGAGLAITQADLLPIQPASISNAFGLHPSLGSLYPLFAAGNLAVVCNVGPLISPISKNDYLAGAPRPYQLFSHSDQIAQWQSSISTGPSPSGWGGRIADNFGPQSLGFPTITALSGGAFTRGLTTTPLSVAPAPTTLPQLLTLNGFGTNAAEQVRRAAMDTVRTLDRNSLLVAAAENTTQQALGISKLFITDPTLSTAFPTTTLGNQLKQVAKLIKFNLTLSTAPLSRQIFFCSLGGFDTHQGQITTQGNLLTQVSDAMKAFYESTLELGIAQEVTTFTLSDFGRTLQPAGQGTTAGSDHAWGNHHIVMGGAVLGGDFYGVRGPNGTVFPTLELSGPNDTDTRGRWIPTSSVDQYAATLARWLGVDSNSIPSIFPQIGNFSPTYLGFLP